MRKKWTLILVLALAAAVLAAGTWAYFSVQGRADSVITLGSVRLALHNETGTGEPAGDTAVLPGGSAVQTVFVENTGESAFYTRVKLELEAFDSSGAAMQLPAGFVTLDLNLADWTPGADGYYYYNEAVAPGAATAALFQTVRFSDGMDDSYLGASLRLRLTAEAVQTRNLEQYAQDGKTSGVWEVSGPAASAGAETQFAPQNAGKEGA